MKKALIVYGGWEGHEPVQVSEIFERELKALGFEVERSPDQAAWGDGAKLKELDLIVPLWTMGEIKGEYCKNVSEAVASGVGLAGCHGGMCDSFRNDTLWQHMTGAQWVAHPGGGIPYTVEIKSSSNPITEGLKNFEMNSEQYCVHVDPCIEVLATTRVPSPHANDYHSSNPACDMPVVFTKRWGHGRVFYSSLGHVANVFDAYEPLEMMRRGFIWAARGKEIAVRDGLSVEDFHKPLI